MGGKILGVVEKCLSSVGIIVTLGFLLIILLTVWAVAFPHRSSSDGSVSLADADDCPIALPESARNIQYETYSHWIAFQDFVRFEASVDVCKAHAEAVYADWHKIYSDSSDTKIPKFEPLARKPYRIRSSELDISWFDVQNIENGLIAEGGPSVPTIWIDLDRGVFYYRYTD